MFRNTFKDKAFIKRVLIIALPIVFQQLFLTTLGITDAVMVGVDGVAAVNFANLFSNIVGTVIFGITVGIGLYIAQYYGDRDYPKIRKSMALLIIIVLSLSILFTSIGFFFTDWMLDIFTDDRTLITAASSYLVIACFSYIPNMLSYCFAIGYRNVQRTIVPLITSVITLVVNVSLNYVLINGALGFPKLGLVGAAIATVVSSTIAFLFNWIYATSVKEVILPKMSDFKECLNVSFAMPKLKRTLPFLLNETIFSAGVALYGYFFLRFGTEPYTAYSIAETLSSIMIIVIIGLGTAVGSMVGECLGKRDFDEAKRLGNNFLVLGIFISIALGLITVIFARPLVAIFGSTNKAVVDEAVMLLYVFAIRISLRVLVVIMFSIFRAGGKSLFVMVVDSGVMWFVGILAAVIGYYVFHIEKLWQLYLLVQLEPLVRILICFKAYWQNKWCQNVLHN